LESKKKLLFHFEAFLKVERKARQIMEKSLTDQYTALVHTNQQELEQLAKEFERQKHDKSYFEMQKSLYKRAEQLSKYEICTLMADRDKVSEDAHQCHYCTDFAYTSMIHCEFCQINYCTSHSFMCGCAVPSLSLVYRYSNEELG